MLLPTGPPLPTVPGGCAAGKLVYAVVKRGDGRCLRYGEPMQRLTEETVLAVGRLTLAATELEYVLAWIGADQAGGDQSAVFAVPGEPLRAARGSVQFACPNNRNEFIGLVDAAELYLTQSHRAVRAMWSDNHRVDAATLDEITGLLLRCRDRLQRLLDEAGRVPTP